MFGAGPGDTGGIGFLEGVVTDQMRRYLTGQTDHWNAVHQRIGKTGHRVGGAGTRRDQHNADFARRPGITFRHMDRATFLAHENMLELVLLEDRVINWQHCAARIAEHGIHTLIYESFDNNFSAGHFLISHLRSPFASHADSVHAVRIQGCMERKTGLMAGFHGSPRTYFAVHNSCKARKL